MSEAIDCINLGELEARARKLLPQMAYDYYAGGANDEITLRENQAAYQRLALLPHMLVDVSVRHMSTTVLGEPVSMPILIAPTALPGLAHSEGEIATTRAAGAAKTLITLATLSTSSIEEAMAVATGPVWFQLYVFKDREVTATKFRNPSRIFMSQCELGRRAPAPVLEDRILLVAGGGHRAFCFLIWADVMRTPDQKALYQIMLLREDCINCSAEAESRHTRSQDVRESVALSQQLCNRSESDRDAPKQMEGSRNNATLENNRF